ncbi:MAG: hypothetical protein Q4B54_09215 [Coriobacteriales bacterium]|nr:hypothetical protein [Coriobacteriales bacterium]
MAANSRQRIQQALFSLLEEWPLEQITVSEVASRANVSRTTYYRLYGSLESVLNDALDELFARVEPLVPHRSADGNYDERLIELSIYQMLYCYQREVNLLGPLMRGSSDTILLHRMYYFALDLVKKYVDDDREDTVKAMEQTYIAAGMTAVMCQWLAHDCAEPINDVLDLILRVPAKSFL